MSSLAHRAIALGVGLLLFEIFSPADLSACVGSERSPGQAVGYDAIQLVGVGLTSQ